MTNKSHIIAALMALTQASWMVQIAHAQPGEHGRSEGSQHPNKVDRRQDEQKDLRKNRQPMPAHEPRMGHDAPTHSGQVQIGGYFKPQHWEAAREYYGRPENQGFCPRGLAKKGHGCLPPSQTKKWRQGYPLPPSVMYYDVPRSMVLTLGAPPPGYRYVRVASDILLIAVGSNTVMDSIENLVR